MSKLFKLQITGPLALFLALFAAEVAAYGLAWSPSSAFLWYMNLELFGLLQRSHAAISAYIDIPGAQLFAIALPVLLLAVYGLAARQKLVLAIASNLSFAGAAFVLFMGKLAGHVSPQASLVTILTSHSDGLTVWSAVLAASLVSAILSHTLYLAAIRREA